MTSFWCLIIERQSLCRKVNRYHSQAHFGNIWQHFFRKRFHQQKLLTVWAYMPRKNAVLKVKDVLRAQFNAKTILSSLSLTIKILSASNKHKRIGQAASKACYDASDTPLLKEAMKSTNNKWSLYKTHSKLCDKRNDQTKLWFYVWYPWAWKAGNVKIKKK